MKFYLICFIGCVGCGIQSFDARNATYTVDSQDLKPHVEKAISVWQKAGANISWKEGSCIEGSAEKCVSISRGEVDDKNYAETTWYWPYNLRQNVLITIGYDTPDKLLDDVMTHEIGHVFGLDHSTEYKSRDYDYVFDLMNRYTFENRRWCIGESTSDEWKHLYNDSLRNICWNDSL